MIDFFAAMFLIGLVGFIIFVILLFIFQNEVISVLAAICLVAMIVSGIGMEVGKAKEPKECECECCSACETEMVEKEIK